MVKININRNKDLRKQWVRVISFLLKDRRKKQTAKVRQEANKRRQMRQNLFTSSKWSGNNQSIYSTPKRNSGIGGYSPLASSSEPSNSSISNSNLPYSNGITPITADTSIEKNTAKWKPISHSESTEMTGWLMKKGKKVKKKK